MHSYNFKKCKHRLCLVIKYTHYINLLLLELSFKLISNNVIMYFVRVGGDRILILALTLQLYYICQNDILK